jgi:hypothetical protein
MRAINEAHKAAYEMMGFKNAMSSRTNDALVIDPYKEEEKLMRTLIRRGSKRFRTPHGPFRTISEKQRRVVRRFLVCSTRLAVLLTQSLKRCTFPHVSPVVIGLSHSEAGYYGSSRLENLRSVIESRTIANNGASDSVRKVSRWFLCKIIGPVLGVIMALRLWIFVFQLRGPTKWN